MSRIFPPGARFFKGIIRCCGRIYIGCQVLGAVGDCALIELIRRRGRYYEWDEKAQQLWALDDLGLNMMLRERQRKILGERREGG